MTRNKALFVVAKDILRMCFYQVLAAFYFFEARGQIKHFLLIERTSS